VEALLKWYNLRVKLIWSQFLVEISIRFPHSLTHERTSTYQCFFLSNSTYSHHLFNFVCLGSWERSFFFILLIKVSKSVLNSILKDMNWLSGQIIRFEFREFLIVLSRPWREWPFILEGHSSCYAHVFAILIQVLHEFFHVSLVALLFAWHAKCTHGSLVLKVLLFGDVSSDVVLAWRRSLTLSQIFISCAG